MGRTAAATKEPPKFLRVADVAAMLDISESHAYKIMRQLNKELEAKGKQYRLKLRETALSCCLSVSALWVKMNI